ncbi:MAG: hypothetical protein QM710_07420 [Flavobacterium sp.]
MKKLFAIMLLVFFCSCSRKAKNPYPQVIAAKPKNVVQVNTKTMLHRSLQNGEGFFVGNFDTDTVAGNMDDSTEEKYIKRFAWDTVLPKYDFKIIIDTSYTIAAKGFEHRNIGFTKEGRIDFSKVFSLWKDNVECYPLLIYNNGNKPAYNKRIRFIQEAKDTDGKWKPIEFFAEVPSCIPNIVFYEYLPKKYSMLSIIKYHGGFKTKIRVKMELGRYIYYSNEIAGHINKTQFDKTIARDMLRFYCQFCDGSQPVSEELVSHAFLQKVR